MIFKFCLFVFILFSLVYTDNLSDIYEGFKTPPSSFYHTYDEIVEKLLDLSDKRRVRPITTEWLAQIEEWKTKYHLTIPRK